MQSPRKRQKLYSDQTLAKDDENNVRNSKVNTINRSQRNLPIWQAKEQLVKELKVVTFHLLEITSRAACLPLPPGVYA